MIRKYKLILFIICGLALVTGAYFLFMHSSREKTGFGGKGLSRFRVETFRKPTGYGYRIYQDTIPVIEQQYLPGIEGTIGFSSEQLARKTGELVCRKLDQGIFPPTITPSELDSLGVVF